MSTRNSLLNSQQTISAPHKTNRSILFGFWALVFISIPIWTHFDPPGWDVGIYHNAMRSLAAGHDPYSDAMAIQQWFHSQKVHPAGAPPYSYVYSPITLPFLHLVNSLPLWLSGGLYWLIYLAGVLCQVWVGMQAAETTERRYFLYFAPVAAFFPGLLADGTVISGNIAFILYGAVLLAAAYGWKHGKWLWFYLAIIAASCVKAPLLSLVVIAVLSARKQWIPAGLTIVAGVALFAVQPLIWPDLFKHYLQAVELQFSYNRDFGCSPAGLFSGVLYDHGISYSRLGLLFYLAYAIPTLALLFFLSRRFLQGSFSLRQWIPVLLVGVILLNPRIMEYDVAPLALPLTFIAWRFLSTSHTVARTILYLSIFFAVTNILAIFDWQVRKLMDGPLLVIFFLVGSWDLYQLSRSHAEARNPSTLTGITT